MVMMVNMATCRISLQVSVASHIAKVVVFILVNRSGERETAGWGRLMMGYVVLG